MLVMVCFGGLISLSGGWILVMVCFGELISRAGGYALED